MGQFFRTANYLIVTPIAFAHFHCVPSGSRHLFRSGSRRALLVSGLSVACLSLSLAAFLLSSGRDLELLNAAVIDDMAKYSGQVTAVSPTRTPTAGPVSPPTAYPSSDIDWMNQTEFPSPQPDANATNWPLDAGIYSVLSFNSI